MKNQQKELLQLFPIYHLLGEQKAHLQDHQFEIYQTEEQNRVDGLERELRNILLFCFRHGIINKKAETDSNDENTQSQDSSKVDIYREQSVGKDGTDDTTGESTQTPQTMKRRHDVAPIHLLYQACLRIGGNVHQIRHHSESNKTQNQMKNRSTATDAEKNHHKPSILWLGRIS